MDNEPVSEQERVQAAARFGPGHDVQRLKQVREHACETREGAEGELRVEALVT